MTTAVGPHIQIQKLTLLNLGNKSYPQKQITKQLTS